MYQVPVVFDGCTGWFHPGTSSTGVVLCGPLGPEADYAHRSWREFAHRLAALGISTLRFDYRGQRDSAEYRVPDQPVRAWVDSAKNAVEWLRSEAGLKCEALVGFRLGSLIALHAAEELGGIGRLVLMAPPISGKAYLRELSVLRGLSQVHLTQDSPATKDTEDTVFSKVAMRQIELLGLRTGRIAPARRILTVARPGGPLTSKFEDALRKLGTVCETTPFDGYSALMVNPEAAVFPKATFDRVTSWLLEDQHLPLSQVSKLALPTSHLVRVGVRETNLSFRESSRLYGVMSKPVRPSADLPAIVFLNTGAISRAGMSGMWVTLARAFAGLGYSSLRFDLAGIGDSPIRVGQKGPFLHMQEAVTDVNDTLDWLETQGYHKFILVGFCWGAQLACNIAMADPRIEGQILINPRRWFWSLDTLQAPMLSLRRVLSMAGTTSGWARLQRGHIPLSKIIDAALHLIHRALGPFHSRKNSSHNIKSAIGGLRELSSRGVESIIIQGADDPLLQEFEAFFDTPRDRLGELFAMKTHFAVGVGHLFQSRNSLDNLVATASEHLRSLKSSRSTPRRAKT